VLLSAFSAASSASAAPSFRLLLIGLFRFLALQARPAGHGAQSTPLTDYWFVVVNLLAGSLIGHADALNHPAPGARRSVGAYCRRARMGPRDQVAAVAATVQTVGNLQIPYGGKCPSLPVSQVPTGSDTPVNRFAVR
jgi:hypothetical protein